MNRAITSILTVGIILAGTSFIDRTYHPKSMMSRNVAPLFPGESTDREVLALDWADQKRLLALLNQGASRELSDVNGISGVRGTRIEEARPYQKPEDVLKVKGVGKRTFRNLVAHVDSSFH